MSSEPTANRAAPVTSVVGALAWLAVAAALALGGAGLVAEVTHAPGGPAREELTFRNDRALGARLDDASTKLQAISGNVDRISNAAKAALTAISSADSQGLKNNLDRGNGAAILIGSATRDLRDSLAGLPGDGLDATLTYSNATLVRRAEILAALDSALGLAGQWAEVTGNSTEVARLLELIADHETQVASAAAIGRTASKNNTAPYADAITQLQTAKGTLDEIASLRAELISDTGLTVLDEWIARHSRYDDALISLYRSLVASGGKVTLDVQAADREEKLARAQLPPDNRSIIVIIAQVAQSGLNQAVIAIEDARGRLDQALAESSPT